ncbi:MAG: MutS-related protein, partial [Planctomycetaceae bacterium]
EQHDGRLVFLHRVAPGAADKSWGVHVARLAGVPEPVIERARDLLQGFESGAAPPSEGARPADQIAAVPADQIAAVPADALTPARATGRRRPAERAPPGDQRTLFD